MLKIKKILDSISLTGRKKRMFEKYMEERLKIEEMGELKLHCEYIELQSKLEYRKNVFAILMIGLMMSVLTGIWKSSIDLIRNVLKKFWNDELTVVNVKIVIMIILFIAIVMGLLILFSIFMYLDETRKLYRKKLLLEEVMKKRGKGNG